MQWSLSVWSLHVLPLRAWVLPGNFDVLLQTRDTHVDLTDDAKLDLNVNVHEGLSVSQF